MRIGICSIQQSLTPEATNLVKLAITLARRRGHAQVTPLHVASAMLANSQTSLLRTACIQSQTHPLQLKALELCFNVALNRLPSSASSPLLLPQTMSAYYPSLSNALVAAFKRAQTHQRRGCVENQQQPILALKIEIEQLVISILDDPSVSRVMREAGFSSPLVKNNVEQVVSMEFCPQNLIRSKPLLTLNNTNVCKYGSSSSQYEEATSKIRQLHQFENDDVLSLVNTLSYKKSKSIVIVGETLSAAEAVANGVISKIETGEVDNILRHIQFTSLFNFTTLKNLTKQDVEQRLMELRGVIKGYGNQGMALYLGDLKWFAETWSSYTSNDQPRRNYLYNPLEHVVMELRKLSFADSGKVWLIGSASSKTYMKCKLGHPSLESILELHPVKVPICSLDLSLKIESDMFDEPKTRWFEVEALMNDTNRRAATTTDSMTSKLPSWMQQCKDEFDSKLVNSPLLKKTRITEKDLMLSMSTPCSPTSVSSNEQLNVTHLSWPVACEESKGSPKNDDVVPDMEVFMTEISSKPELLSNPNSSPNSATSSEVDMDAIDEDDLPKLNELNDENVKAICNALEKKAAPCQKGAFLDIATTVLKCRSRAMKRKGSSSEHENIKEDTWMCFTGDNNESKENAAKELSQLIFGSIHNFIKMDLSQNSSDTSTGLKRKREEEMVETSNNFLERFRKAVYENPHCVFYLKGLDDQFNATTQNGLQEVIESGNVKLPNGETVRLEDAIVILSIDSSSQVTKGYHNLKMENDRVLVNSTASVAPSLDLNIAAAAAADEQLNSLSLSSVACNGILELVDRIVVFKT